MRSNLTANQLRQEFLDFFHGKGHEIVQSSPVVPHDDPTLLFTNAGMNQFKDVFLATGTRPYKRAADTQKCIRAGGKHNDLDDVGQDTYHHTFFEMLGNWSFGDYFKKEAIAWAWELLTEVWGIDKSRLHVTYFEGDTADGLEPDTEAAELWKNETDIDPTHIHPGNKKDNFWEMGETGPCGPCSEIHVDTTPDKSGAALVNAGDARVIEIWNLVFIQFNRAGDGKLSPLPAKHVDTGMGFERLCALMQGKSSNYDTDVFSPIFEAIQKRTGAPAYKGLLPGMPTDHPDHTQLMVDVTYRVMADHIRCLTFAITDGAMPSNEGRGYVLRRILRRAVRYGRQYLNMHEPFLCDLIKPLVEHMGDVFPELRDGPDANRPRDNVAYIAEILRDEEASFGKTLDRGIKLFNEAADHARKHHHSRVSGDDAFKLHDTYGFPIDLTELMAEEQELTVDIGEYERLMEVAREKARKPWSRQGDFFNDAESRLMMRQSASQPTRFVGWDTTESRAKVLWVTAGSNPDGDALYIDQDENKRAAIVLDQTPFYAEKGGQVGDRGVIETTTGEFVVDEVVELDERIVHLGHCTRGRIWCYDPESIKHSPQLPATTHPREQAKAVVDVSCRIPIMQNHTGTHILNWALREVLGDHVQQKGSLVDSEKTRFDFSHPKPLTDEELARIEDLCNGQIEADYHVYTKEVDQEAARKINTLRAVFGEKYPDVVRVVSVGADIDDMLANPADPKWMKYSVEFCGGTHLKTSREAERLVLTSEEGVAKGIRRLVGVTGDTAKQAIETGEAFVLEVDACSENDSLSECLADIQNRINTSIIPLRTRRMLLDKLAELQKIAKKQDKLADSASADDVREKVAALLDEAETIGDVRMVVGEVPTAKSDALRGAIDWIRQKTDASAVLLVCVDDGKVTLLAGMSKSVVGKGVKAGDLIKEIAPLVGGRGGGRPDMAQGGGNDPAGVTSALNNAKQWITNKLSA